MSTTTTETAAPGASSRGGGGGGGTTHVVAEGETLLSIAHAHGFRSWEVIWNDPANASLRERRPDPQVLAAGDEVVIPELKTVTVDLETNRRHVLRVRSVAAWFRTVLVDDFGKALANRRFILEVGERTVSGMTDSSGRVQLPVDPTPAEGTLTVFMGTTPEQTIVWKLKLGYLDPIETLRGVKARLTNLGFVCGAIDDQQDDETTRALRDFQIVHRLPVTGEADDATRARLVQVHDGRR